MPVNSAVISTIVRRARADRLELAQQLAPREARPRQRARAWRPPAARTRRARSTTRSTRSPSRSSRRASRRARSRCAAREARPTSASKSGSSACEVRRRRHEQEVVGAGVCRDAGHGLHRHATGRRRARSPPRPSPRARERDGPLAHHLRLPESHQQRVRLGSRAGGRAAALVQPRGPAAARMAEGQQRALGIRALPAGRERREVAERGSPISRTPALGVTCHRRSARRRQHAGHCQHGPPAPHRGCRNRRRASPLPDASGPEGDPCIAASLPESRARAERLTLPARPGTPSPPCVPRPTPPSSCSRARRRAAASCSRGAGVRFEVVPADVPEEARARAKRPRRWSSASPREKAVAVRDRWPRTPRRAGARRRHRRGARRRRSSASRATRSTRSRCCAASPGARTACGPASRVAATGARRAPRRCSVASRVTLRAAAEAELARLRRDRRAARQGRRLRAPGRGAPLREPRRGQRAQRDRAAARGDARAAARRPALAPRVSDALAATARAPCARASRAAARARGRARRGR